MAKQKAVARSNGSVFEPDGLKKTLSRHFEEIRELYLEDDRPWVVGYSGGKDSTATLQLIWLALLGLDEAERRKPVHVISTDTLVENPVVASWVGHSLDSMSEAARMAALPIEPHRLTPAVQDTFWVNLIGRGYPSPRNKFRWCTERLKIKPSNTFIVDLAQQYGEAILVLGTRKAESQARARNMAKHEQDRHRARLSPNAALPNCLIYTPIEDWSNDDVWMFLMQVKNPWGYKNKDLLTMYQGASPDGECPLVVDTTTPSCGDSRFGCWVCTVVDEDKSMSAMIQNDTEKEWMAPLLQYRNELGRKDDRDKRDFRRITGKLTLHNDRLVHGPYTQQVREEWLRRLLEVQERLRKTGPEDVADVSLITDEELAEIRRIWVTEKHEIEDRLPAIFEEVTEREFPGAPIDDGTIFDATDLNVLREACEDDEVHYQLIRELLNLEQRYKSQARRKGFFAALRGALQKHFYGDEEDALDRARRHEIRKKAARSGDAQVALSTNPGEEEDAALYAQAAPSQSAQLLFADSDEQQS